MAIAYARTENISRGKGHSAVAAAAYRAGESIFDARTGHTHNYAGRKDVRFTTIILPENAPGGWQSETDISALRAVLWNRAELAEKHPRAVVVREWKLAIPHEFSKKQQEQIVQEMAAFICERHGVAIDIAIHDPVDTRGMDKRNVHAHFLITTRRLDASGFSEKSRELDKKTTSGAHLKAWRAEWQRLVNKRFKQSGSSARIDMRSYKARGMDTEPQIHMGKNATQRKRKGLPCAIADANREIRRRNRQRKAIAKKADIIDFEAARLEREIAQTPRSAHQIRQEQALDTVRRLKEQDQQIQKGPDLGQGLRS